MKTHDHTMTRILRSLALVGVIITGLLSIIATTGGSSTGDDPPQFFADAGPDRNIEEGISVLLDGTGSQTPLGVNPDDTIVGYFWEIASTPPFDIDLVGLSPYTIDDQNRIVAQLRVKVPGEYIARLRVDYQNQTAFDTVTLMAHEGFVPPNSEAGPDQFVKHGALVTMDGSNSEELQNIASGGEAMTYQWFIADQPDGTTPLLSSNDVVNPTFVAEHNPDDASSQHPHYSSYQLRLHTIDTTQLVSQPTHVNVFVFPPEGYAYPMPIAGPEQRVLTGSTVNLDGSASYDIDGRPLTYDWQFYSRAPRSRATLTGADTATPSFVADTDGVYVVQLVVSNGALSSFRGSGFPFSAIAEATDYVGVDRVVVFASSENSWPVPDAGPDRIRPYTGAESIALDGSGSYDADGHMLTYNWQLVDAPAGSGASIDNPFDTVPDSASLLADIEGTYVVGLNTYPFEEQFDQALITLTTNSAPVADAGPDQAVSTGVTVNLVGSASSDSDGDTLEYSWSMVAAPDPWGLIDGVWHDWPSLSNARSATPSFTTGMNGSYVLRLTVNDGQFSSATDEVIIAVAGSTGNTPPLADAGPDQPGAVTGVQVFLDGSGSTDVDGDPLTYLWSFDSRPAGSVATLSDTTAIEPSFTPDLDGAYIIRLIVNDGQADSVPDTVTVTASSGGACPSPLNLVTALPFLPGTGEAASVFQIDGNDLSVVASGIPLDINAMQATIPDMNNPDQADFIALGPNWEVFSRTHANPISDSDSPSFVIRQTLDNIYYRLDVEFTGNAGLLEVQIDALTGCRCGNDPGNCP